MMVYKNTIMHSTKKKKKTNVVPNWCIHSNKINVPGPTVRSLTIYVTDHFGTRSITEYPDYGLLLHSLDAESKSFAFVPQAFSLGQHESISMQWPIVSGLSVSNIGLAWVMWILSLCVCDVCVHLFIPTHNIFSFHSIPLRCVVSIPTISLLGNDSRRGALICTHYNVAAKMFSNMIIYGRLLSFRFWSRSCNIYECSVVSNFSFWLWLAVLRNRTLMSNARQQEVEDQKKRKNLFVSNVYLSISITANLVFVADVHRNCRDHRHSQFVWHWCCRIVCSHADARG